MPKPIAKKIILEMSAKLLTKENGFHRDPDDPSRAVFDGGIDNRVALAELCEQLISKRRGGDSLTRSRLRHKYTASQLHLLSTSIVDMAIVDELEHRGLIKHLHLRAPHECRALTVIRIACLYHAATYGCEITTRDGTRTIANFPEHTSNPQTITLGGYVQYIDGTDSFLGGDVPC